MKKILLMLVIVNSMLVMGLPKYEYKRELREGARGKWTNLRKHLNSGVRLEKELSKVDRQIEKNINEIQEIENLLFRIEEYKAENGIR